MLKFEQILSEKTMTGLKSKFFAGGISSLVNPVLNGFKMESSGWHFSKSKNRQVLQWIREEAYTEIFTNSHLVNNIKSVNFFRLYESALLTNKPKIIQFTYGGPGK